MFKGLTELNQKLNQHVFTLNNSKYFAGIMMILLNLGSRYLIMELSETQEQMFNNVIIRRFIIFTIVFIATRDIYVSLILTAIFIVFVSNLFNENSNYCIIKKQKKIFKSVTKNDYEKAKSVIKLYELQNES
jgi:hypothetical protein